MAANKKKKSKKRKISTAAATNAAASAISTSAAAAGTAQYGLMYPEPNDTHGHGIKESHPPRYAASSGVVKKKYDINGELTNAKRDKRLVSPNKKKTKNVEVSNNPVDTIPPYTPRLRDPKLSPEYYEAEDVYIATLQHILKALIERSPVIKKLCTNLQLDDNDNFVIDVHPIFATTVNLEDNTVCKIVVGHYASVRQGNYGVMTEKGEGTCLTFDQLLAAARKIDPAFNLRRLGFTEDLLPLKFPFENTKGEKFLATRDVLNHFTKEETNELNLARTSYYTHLFVEKMKQGTVEFRIVFYGEGKQLRRLFNDAFHQAKDIMRACSDANEFCLDKIVLKMKEVPHWGIVIYPISTEQKVLLDEGVAFLLGVDVACSTYFQCTDFAHLQFCGKGSGQGMLACLIAILKKNRNTDLLDTILNSNVDQTTSKYSDLNIEDATVLSSLGRYLGLHCDAIIIFINSELNDTSTKITRSGLTVRHLAQYLSFRRWGNMTKDEREAAMLPIWNARDEWWVSMTDEQRVASMQKMWNARDERWASMTDEQLQLALCAMNEKLGAKCGFYVCTIFNEAVYIAKNLWQIRNESPLGYDSKSTVKNVKAAIMEHGYYPYFGIKFCKVIPLDDWIEMAPKDQRGKNDHL